MKNKCVADIGFDCVCYFSAFSKLSFHSTVPQLAFTIHQLKLKQQQLI